MPGLMPQTSGPAQAEMMQPQQADQVTMGEGDANVSPEEQKQYDQFVGNALTMISSPKTRSGILQSLAGDGNPKEGLATTAALIVKEVSESAKKSGMEISGDVMLHGGVEIVEALAETQASAGIADLDPEEIEGAMYQAADLYRGMAAATGSLNQQAAMQDIETLKAAQEQGQLGTLLPGIDQAQGEA